MKVSLVNGICVRHDAISEVVRGTALALAGTPGIETRLFTYTSDYTDIDVQRVSSCTDILLDRFFNESDVILYHFGIYCELFNALLLGNGRAPQVVRYHNVTPKEFLEPGQHLLLNKSLAQIANMESATRIWADSKFNKQHLVEYGIKACKIDVSPLYVKSHFKVVQSGTKPIDAVHILYVGRFVRSKGLLDLVEAVTAVQAQTEVNFHVDMVGNLSFSDPTYLASVRASITRNGLDKVVHIHSNLDDHALWERFQKSHIFVMPSYHEGFCIPVIEALRAQCLPITYNSGNLPDIVQELGEIVETGDIGALSEHLLRHVRFFGEQNRYPEPDAIVALQQGRLSLQDLRERMGRRARSFSYEAFSDRVCAAVSALA
jgi:glycosyltransferase involved in cell wall biosynthesis